MAVLQHTELAEHVDHVAEILAPVVYRALQVIPRGSPDPPMGREARTKHRDMVPAELSLAQRLLVAAAAGDFGSKLFPRCIPEHAALVDGLERVIAKLLPADHRGTEKPTEGTETEMRLHVIGAPCKFITRLAKCDVQLGTIIWTRAGGSSSGVMSPLD